MRQPIAKFFSSKMPGFLQSFTIDACTPYLTVCHEYQGHAQLEFAKSAFRVAAFPFCICLSRRQRSYSFVNGSNLPRVLQHLLKFPDGALRLMLFGKCQFIIICYFFFTYAKFSCTQLDICAFSCKSEVGFDDARSSGRPHSAIRRRR